MRNLVPAERSVYTADDLRDWAVVTAGMRPQPRLAVFGDPVAHSASPPMHNAALAACGIATRYVRVLVRPADLAEALSLVMRAGFIGVNLTIPHKTAALPLLNALDPHAALVAAVNTVRVEPAGTLIGFNTDGPGFVRAVRADLGLELEGTTVLILGAGGGAGRALATQCVLARCARVILVNRTRAKVERLAEEMQERFAKSPIVCLSPTNLEIVAWEDAGAAKMLAGVDLVVNASSVGLDDDDPSPLPAEAMSARLRVFDTVYRASGEATPLLLAAEEAGAKTAGGRSLLLHQGALAFEHWFKAPAPLETMRRALAG